VSLSKFLLLITIFIAVNAKRNRSRTIYQNELIYTHLNATGYHFNGVKEDTYNAYRNLPFHSPNGNQVRQLHRIQNINYGFTMNRKDVNTFGQAARIDSVATENPSVFLNFEYILADGYNESVCGFVTDGLAQCVTKHLMGDFKAGQNFFIVTGPQGHDIIGAPLDNFKDGINVMGIGNCFLNQYAVTASVGALPRAKLSYEAYNIKSYSTIYNNYIPAIDTQAQNPCPDIKFSIPDTFESFTYPKLVGLNDIEYQNSSKGITPASIRLFLDDPALLSTHALKDGKAQHGNAIIQGFTINMPLPNTKLSGLGRTFEVARVPNYPATVSIKITAILAELKRDVALYQRLCSKDFHEIYITMHDHCAIDACGPELTQSSAQITFRLKKVVLMSEGLEHSVNDPHRTVELDFNCQISGPEDLNSGFFIWGKSFFPDMPRILAWGHPFGT
jgi:hypothetical protein